MTCRHSRTWIYVASSCMTFISGYSLHSRVVSDSQYRIERREGKPYLVDRSTSDSWQIDRNLLEMLEDAKKAASLEEKAR